MRVGDGDDQIFAVDNFDPFSHAFVIARGIVGDRGGVPKIASPIFKQSFDLAHRPVPGRRRACGFPTYPTRVRDGRIAVCVTA